MIVAFFKIVSGFVIGASIGKFTAKNQLSPILGISLTVSGVLLACVIIDKIAGIL